MTKDDLVKLIGGSGEGADYVPVAFLLKSGYGCAGHFNADLNKGFADLCVILNVELIELRPDSAHGRPAIQDFREFLEEVVMAGFDPGKLRKRLAGKSDFGKTVPIAAIPLGEIAVIYPVSQIETLMRRVETRKRKAEKTEKGTKAIPSFLDVDKSEVLAVLRTKLW